MSASTQDIVSEVFECLDRLVEDIGVDQYREVLEEILGQNQCRLDCWHEENPDQD